MVDLFYAVKGQLRRPGYDPRYTADQAIISVTLTEVPDSTTLTVVFPFWHAPLSFNKSLQRRTQNRGTNVLLYDFNPLILNKDCESVTRSFEFIAKSVLHDVVALREAKNYTKINLLGFSLGVVSLCLVADELNDFADVTLVVPGDDLAASLWTGLRTYQLRKEYLHAGETLADLQKQWNALAPITHAHIFRDHNVRIILAKHDQFIRYRHGNKLFAALQQSGTNVTREITRFGHVTTIWQFLHSA